MSKTFQSLLDECELALADASNATFPRATLIAWAKEAMLAFPILRPQLDDHTNGASVVKYFQLPANFRDMMYVEYPIGETPPSYLLRKNHLDPDFFNEDGFYDIDHDYTVGTGWYMFVSGGVAADAHIKTYYLANHDIDLADDGVDVITIPDEYINILILYVVCKAYRERLAAYMTKPTAFSNLIQQMVYMVNKSEDNYHQLVTAAMSKLADSKITPNIEVDKFDRIY